MAHRAHLPNSGLAYWMEQVLKQANKAAQGFAADPVHDLRVALRRCRSMAEGIRAIDPDPSWKKMRKMGKLLFASLGTLRDCQVLMEWTEKLGTPDDPVVAALLAYCRTHERALKQQTEAALQQFDRKQWQSWARSLPRRAARLRLGSEPFLSLALDRWTRARRLHNRAVQTGNPAAFHRLRIGLKKFRYVVENFLPQHHQEWAEGLKRAQDLLGEIHDLDVFWETALAAGVLASEEARERWQQRITAERVARTEEYLRETSGTDSLWQIWRRGLPRGQQARNAAFKKLEVWASFLDPDVRHSRRVARLALQLHDGLARAGLLGQNHKRSRELLQAAATVHEVGRSGGRKGHHKATQRLVQEVERPFSWKRQDLDVIAYIARYHRGALPGRSQDGLRSLPATVQRTAQRLAGVLRLANAMDAQHAGTIRRIKVGRPGDYAVIYAEGLNNQTALAERIAGARHLLEFSCGIAILVRPMPGRAKSLKKKDLT
ncbi:MAG TPA: CHAD domain-containing protein [Candidatus Angelobacter sp.]